MRNILLTSALAPMILTANAQSKLTQDRAAIKALAGTYKVTFNYAETFSPIKDYKYHDRYRSSAKELALIIEESPKKIVIQHLLVMGDSLVVKHWREDWVYEDPQLFVYDKDNTWKRTSLLGTEIKGKWTQKVFQVDDSPRYQATGSWIHADGKHQWIGFCDSPLPRREDTERNDYNVLSRRNFVYLTDKGWMFEQDNKKIIRDDSGDKLLAMEKGLEEFVKIDHESFAYAQNWWKSQDSFWKDVRDSWAEVFAKSDFVKLLPKKDNKILYEQMLELGDQSVKEKWTSLKNKKAIKKILDTYLTKS